GTQAATAVLKLAVVPAVTWAVCTAAGVGPLATGVAVLFMALPTASTSYVMARAMGGNAPLMAAITSNQHILAAATLPVWAWLLTG
ncbi:AEC family transporter, partial [Falsiroseomonas oryziterrae]|uniref:AEC family transporter n=1 Tax=Falsiroseomonas oryziterrae TaxID=2911368 RepID=UPI0035581929